MLGNVEECQDIKCDILTNSKEFIFNIVLFCDMFISNTQGLEIRKIRKEKKPFIFPPAVISLYFFLVSCLVV